MILIEGPANIYYGPSFCCNYTDTNENTEWSTNVSSINTFLGRTENGVQYTMNNALDPVYVDDNGGTEGDPVEHVIKNTTATLRTVIVDFGDATGGTTWQTIVNKLEGGYNDSNLPKIGTPVFGTNRGFALKIVGPSSVAVVIPRCSIAEQPRQWNINTSHKKLALTFSAYPIMGHAVNSSGVYSVAYNYIWHKVTYSYSMAQCYDAIGGYNTTATANNQYNN